MQQKQAGSSPQLSRTPGFLMLWGMGVGYLTPGMYFGWNPGLEKGGTYGLTITTFFIIILNITFTFSYTELACAIPKAGVVLDCGDRAPGKTFACSRALILYLLSMITVLMPRKKEPQMLPIRGSIVSGIRHCGAADSHDFPDCYDNAEW